MMEMKKFAVAMVAVAALGGFMGSKLDDKTQEAPPLAYSQPGVMAVYGLGHTSETVLRERGNDIEWRDHILVIHYQDREKLTADLSVALDRLDEEAARLQAESQRACERGDNDLAMKLQMQQMAVSEEYYGCSNLMGRVSDVVITSSPGCRH